VTVGRGDRGVQRFEREGRRHFAVRIDDPWMSNAHVSFAREAGRWIVEDAGSRNGTRLNGAILERSTLEDGDLVEAGRSVFLFRTNIAATLEQSLGEAPFESDFGATLSPPRAREFARLAKVTEPPVDASPAAPAPGGTPK